MADDPEWYKPHRPPDPPRQPQPGELLFEFYRERDHTRWRRELRQHPEPFGVEAQFSRNEEFHYSRRFDTTMSRERTPREMAVTWAYVVEGVFASGRPF
jgi:hypothetical protein